MKKVKDPFCGYSDLFGFILSITGLVLLVIFSAMYGEGAWDIVSFTIFGTGIVLLYLFSSLHHLLNLGSKGTTVFKKFDNIMMYIFISCCFTPICLGPLRGSWGWSIFGVSWFLSILGTTFSAIWVKPPKWITTAIYLLFAWLIIISIHPLSSTFTTLGALNSLWWLLRFWHFIYYWHIYIYYTKT